MSGCLPDNSQHQSREKNSQQAHVVEQHDLLECPTTDALGKSVANPTKSVYTKSKSKRLKDPKRLHYKIIGINLSSHIFPNNDQPNSNSRRKAQLYTRRDRL